METSLKTGFAQIFSCCPKNLSCPNFAGAAAPLAPPARTPMIPEHWCLVLNLKMCLFRHWVNTFTQSDAVLKRKHRYVKQWTVGRAPKNARLFTTQRTEARLNAQIQRVEFVISRALLLFCSGSLSGNETSFSASKPCWNSVTEMNVYRVFLVSNFMVCCFVSFKAIPLVLV